MSTAINQKEYLKKYLSGSSKEKKKKKKKSIKGQGLRIIDADIDLSKLRPLDGDELDILGEGEDAPQVAGIIDERPEEIRKMEQYNTSSKWRVINQDDGFNSKLQIEEIKKDKKQQEKENEITFGKMYSDSEDEKKTSDASPPRKSNAKSRNSDSDASPPRKSSENQNQTKDDNHSQRKSRKNTSPLRKSTKTTRNDDSDTSPPRKTTENYRNYDRDASSSRKSNAKSKNYDSDASPPRKTEAKTKERRKPSRWGDAETSPSRNSRNKSPSPRRRNYNCDQSPQRKSKKDGRFSPSRRKDKDFNISPPRKSRKDRKSPDSDASPPRKSRKHSKRYKSSDSDASPPRKSMKVTRKNSDSDASPPRKKKSSPVRNKNRNSDSDLSPPRSKRQRTPDSDVSPPRKNRRNSDSPPPSNKKMARTLEGKLAGLQDATQLRKENEAFRKREEEAFRKMTDDVSGRNATVNRRAGKRETSEERRKQKDKAEKQKLLDEKYKKWNKGIKQVEAQEARIADFIHEAAKPLARLKNDKDLENSLKKVERDGDPMAGYMKEKARAGLPERPLYKGNFQPNRFNIRPGYRWDGVDRSNGYEKKYFETQSKKKAQEDEYYKWCSADM